MFAQRLRRRLLLLFSLLGVLRFTDCIWRLSCPAVKARTDPFVLFLFALCTGLGRCCDEKSKEEEEVRREIRRTIRRKLDAFISRDFPSCSRRRGAALAHPFSLQPNPPLAFSLPHPRDESSP